MIYTVRLARLALTVLILITLVFAACQRQGDSPEAESSDIRIALQPLPAEETLVVILTDAAGAPVTDATVALEGNMNHAGMIPVLADATADDADGSADGQYHLPFTFTMLGDWIITVTVTQADGSSFSRNLDVQAREEGIEGENVVPADSAAPEVGQMDVVGEAGSDLANDEASDTHDPIDHQHSDHADDTGAHTANLHVHDAMARPAPLAGGTGAVYFSLHNGSDTPVRLVGADSPAASAVEIHTTINDNGVLRMRQITGVKLEPDQSIKLTPGEMHLMLVDLATALAEGDTVEVTLHFEEGDDLTFEVPVVAMDALPAEDEVAHDH